MSSSASKSRKRSNPANNNSENDQNVSNKKFKSDASSPAAKNEVSSIFGPVITQHCYNFPCFGTFNYLYNAVVVKCNVCELSNCIPCKAVHENQTCAEFKATKVVEIDHEAVFDELKNEGNPEVERKVDAELNMKDSDATESAGEVDKSGELVEEVTGEDKIADFKTGNEDLKDSKLDQNSKQEDSKDSKIEQDSNVTQDYSFLPDNEKQSTPFVGIRKDLFKEDDGSLNEEAADPSAFVSSIDEQDTAKENILEATFEEILEDGSKSYICRACSYSSGKKGMFQKHIKTKKHEKNCASFNANQESSTN